MLDDATRIRLLESIEGKRLVVLCGAGLSIPAPSELMSAIDVSRVCYDRYLPIEALPPAMRDDVDQLSGHFYNAGKFEPVFINCLVPWNELVGTPNAGHAAVADLLIVRGAKVAFSANFDPLIEQWAMMQKVAKRGALDGDDAERYSVVSNPLLKFHGCLIQAREQTLWTRAQLASAAVAQRIRNCAEWMRIKLRGSDLLVVGFWTDWGYLNDVLADVLSGGGFNSVTVIDPDDDAALQGKAPTLWTRLTSVGPNFKHVRDSGAVVLDELRAAFSRVWLKKFYSLGKAGLAASGKKITDADIDATTGSINSEELYNCRRDAEGVPYNRAARDSAPQASGTQAAIANLLLVEAKATRSGPWYTFKGKKIRVVQGAGRALEEVRETYKESSANTEPDVVVCAGAIELGVPGRIIPSGTHSSLVRPGAGGKARWLTLDTARAEFDL